MLSKVKSRKQTLRKKARIDGWDSIPTDRKISKKSGRPIFTKPGSNKK